MRPKVLFQVILGLTSIANAVPSSKLKFTKCTAADPPNLSCATLKVPIDYGDPDAGSTEIFLARIAAKDQKRKIGSLFFNPGGPGVSATEIIIPVGQFNVPLFGEEIHDRFDIIGPDPRGIGRSNPVKCDPNLFNDRVSYQPTTNAEYESLLQNSRLLGESCRNLTGPLLGHLDSQSVARDFEAIREALGDQHFNYLGLSYGTVIGQAYAELFPKNIRAMALDADLDHSLSPKSFILTEAASYENEFVRFANWCANNLLCPLYGTNVKSLLKQLVYQADETPIPAPGCVVTGKCRASVTGQNIRYNFQPLLIFKYPVLTIFQKGWFNAALALKQAKLGDATLLSTPKAKKPSDPVIYENGIQVLCLDWNHTTNSVQDFINQKQLAQGIAPYTQGAGIASYLEARCSAWPESVKYVPHTINVTEAPPILLTNALHDPETAYVWAVGLQTQLQNSVLVTRKGDGHTSYFLKGETYRAINNYLITTKTPPPNTVFDS